MKTFKKYLEYIGMNATDEMEGAMKIILYVISFAVFAVIMSLFVLLSGKVLETIMMIIAFVVLILSVIFIIYIFVKAIYDSIKLTIKWFNKNKNY